MAKTNVTALEAEALNLMAYDLYNQSNGQKPTEFNDVAGGVWTWSVSDSWPHAKRMFSGVMSSLVQKGLAWSQEDSLAGTGRRRHREEPSDAAIGMTELGFSVWQTLDNDPSEPKGMDDGTQNPEGGVAPETAEPVAAKPKTYAIYASGTLVATVQAGSWLEAMEKAESKIGPTVTSVRLVKR